MSLQAAIIEILEDDSDLVDLVGNRIRPDELDESDTLPALIVELESLGALETLDLAAGNTSQVVFAVVCCASSRTEATEIETLVRETLDGFVGTVGDWTFRPITFSSTDFDHDSDEDGGESDAWYYNAAKFDAWAESLV